MADYTIGLVEPTALDEVAQLRHTIFTGTRSENEAYVRWKYLENPFIERPLLWVARHQGEVVAMRGMFGSRWWVPGLDDPLTFPSAAETAVLPAHRDRGLYAELTAVALAHLDDEGYRIAINTSASAANYVTSIMTLGWHKIAGYDQLVRMPRPTTVNGSTPQSRLREGLSRSRTLTAAIRAARSLRRRAARTHSFTRLDARIGNAAPGLVVSEAPPVPFLRDAAAAAHPPDRVRHVYGEDFLRWRYANPSAHFRFLTTGTAATGAYLVLSSSRRKKGIQLMDWSGPDDLVGDLISSAVKLAGTAHVTVWAGGATRDVQDRLRGLGFVTDPARRRSGLIAYPLAGEDAWQLGSHSLLDPDLWDVRMTDSDRF